MVWRLGSWAALATAVLSAAALAIGFVTPVRSGPFCQSACVTYPYVPASSFYPGDYIWILPAILLMPTVLVLMACIDAYAADHARLFGHLGLAFALVYAPIVATDYFLQVTVVVPSLQTGQTEGLSLFTMANPHGLFVALESVGYLALATAFLFASRVFEGGRIERGIRWTYVAGFVLAIALFIGLYVQGTDIVAFEVAILSVDWSVLIITGALLLVVFRRVGRRASPHPTG
jgi:hypothetical protein